MRVRGVRVCGLHVVKRAFCRHSFVDMSSHMRTSCAPPIDW